MKLFSISYSPWSIQARWALAHHGIDYTIIPYTPMLTTARLRWAMQRFNGSVTAPTLVNDGRVWSDSFDIARYAESIGNGTLLFPDGALDAITDWNDRSDAIKDASRVLATAATAASPVALSASLPAMVPKAMRPLLKPVSVVGCKYLEHKYNFATLDESDALMMVRRGLDHLRQALEGDYLLGELTYADIATAAGLNLVLPVADRFIELNPTLRQTWQRSDLADEYADIVAWRDQLFAKHWK